MKKRIIAFTACLALAATLTGALGCTSGQSSTAEADQTPPGAPATMPKTHEGREADNATRCYGCHGNGSLANPQLTEATIIPEDHYLDSSYDSKKIEPVREQCVTCHVTAYAPAG